MNAKAVTALVVGAIVVFIAQRTIGVIGLAWIATTLLMVGHLISREPIDRLRGFALAAMVVGFTIRAAGSETGLDVLGVPVGHGFEQVLRFAWPSVGLSGLIVSIALLGYNAVPREQWGPDTLAQARTTAWRALAVSFAVIFVAAINVAAHARDAKMDLSYLGVTEPSDTTRRMVRGLGEEVRALLLFPEGDEVHARLESFFDTLDDESELFVTERIDHALIPGLATQLRLEGNGIVALVRGSDEQAQAEVVEIGLDLATARPALRTLDGRFQEAFSKLTQPRREVFFTVGHEERGLRGDESNVDERLERFTRALRRFNFAPRQLGLAQGLAQGIGDDVPLVVIAGPREPFSPAEIASLADYVRSGGRILAFVDHEATAQPLLAPFGVEMLEGVVTASTSFVPRTRTDADKQRVYTERYSQHPIVRTARARRQGYATVVHRGAAFAPLEPLPEGIRAVFPVRTEEDAWRDLDDDRVLDDDERAQPERVVAAVTMNRGRAVFIGDGSFGGDDSFGYRGNNALLGDSLQWLIGDLRADAEPIVVGVTTTREDEPIEHKNEDDALIFHATSFGPPILFLVAGIAVARRRRRRSRNEPPPNPSTPTKGEEE